MNKKITLILYDRRYMKDFPDWAGADFEVKQVVNSVDWRIGQRLSAAIISSLIQNVSNIEVKIVQHPNQL